MRAGMALSAVGHAAIVALAVWALPWLRVRPEPTVSVVAVSFVSESAFAALVRRAAEANTPAPAPTVAAPEVERTPLAPRFLPPPEPETPEVAVPAPGEIGLAPAFDAASPLGIPGVEGTVPETEEPPAPPDASVPAEGEIMAGEAIADVAVLRERHMMALATAVRRAKVYPPASRGRGLGGVARLYLVIGRDGSLIELQLVASSGSVSLDRAAVDAARRARLPGAPDDLPGESFGFLQDLEFEPQ